MEDGKPANAVYALPTFLTNTSLSVAQDREWYHNTSDEGKNVTTSWAPPSWPFYLPIYITTLNAIVFFTGVAGNMLVTVVVVMVWDMRTSMNWYLVNLSLADLLVLLVCQPAALTEFFARDRWLLGHLLCKLIPFLEHTMLHASILIILAISAERYFAICKPLKKLVMWHKPRPLKTLSCLWCLAGLSAVPFVFMTRLEHTFFFDGTPCQVCSTRVHSTWHFAYIIGMNVCFFALPMFVLFFLYTQIIRCLKAPAPALDLGRAMDVPNTAMQRPKKRVIKMLVAIVLLFFVFLMPVRCIIIWQIFTSDSQIERLGPQFYYNLVWISRLLTYANSAGNPIIYSVFSSRFQTAVERLMSGRRKDPLDGTHPCSLTSPNNSSRISMAGTLRGCCSPLSSSSTRLSSGSLSQRGSVTSQCNGKKKTYVPRRMRTSSLSAWTRSQIPLTPMAEIKGSPLLKQRSCASMV